MNGENSIDLRVLQAAINRALEHLIREKGIEKVQLEENLYWHIPKDELYKVTDKPTDHDIGSLHDDWEFVQDLTSEQSQPTALQLTEIASLLRYVGEAIPG